MEDPWQFVREEVEWRERGVWGGVRETAQRRCAAAERGNGLLVSFRRFLG